MFWREFWGQFREQFLVAGGFSRLAVKLLDIVLILAMALVLNYVVGKALRRMLKRSAARPDRRRGRTALSITASFFGYLTLTVALVLCLRVLGVNYQAILAGAGVAGIALGFGAQTLVRDLLSGFFLLFEDLISVGDFIVTGSGTDNIEGTVVAVGLRDTRVRAFNGTLYVIPNGELTHFGNTNRGFMRALVTVDLAYEQDPAVGMAKAKEVADAWYAENQQLALEPPVVQGLLNLGDSGIRIRVTCKVQPMKHWEAEQQLRLRLKQAFDAANVELPFPRRVIYVRSETEAEVTKNKS